MQDRPAVHSWNSTHLSQSIREKSTEESLGSEGKVPSFSSLQLPEEGQRRGRRWSPWNPVTGNVRMVQSWAKGGLDWITEAITLSREVKHWKRLPRQVADAPSQSVFMGHLGNDLNTCFNCWRVLIWSGIWARWCCRTLPTDTVYLFYSILGGRGGLCFSFFLRHFLFSL